MGSSAPADVTARAAAKLRKHAPAYAPQRMGFVPLACSLSGLLGDDFLRYLWVLSDEATRGCDVDPSVVHLQRSRLFHRRAAAVSAAVMGFGVSRLLRQPLSCAARVAAVPVAHDWVDGLPLSADLLAVPA